MKTLALKLVSCIVVCLQVSMAAGTDWSALLADAQFQPPTIETLEQQRHAVLQKHTEMLQRFQREQHGQTWVAYLGVAELAELLAIPATALATDREGAKQQTERLDTLRERMVGTHRGLEMQEILAFRKSLSEYVRLRQTFEQQENIAAELVSRLEKLNSILPGSGESFTNDSYHLAALQVQWLKGHKIAPRFTSYLESTARPNVIIRVTDRALENITAKPVSQTDPVDKCEDGRHIVGTAHTAGRAKLVPVPSQGQGNVASSFSQPPISPYVDVKALSPFKLARWPR